MNTEKYVKSLVHEPLGLLLTKSAIYDLNEKLLTREQFAEVVAEILRLYPPHFKSKDNHEVENYLSTVEQRATPEAVKQAKKTIKTYCDQLIYKDEKQAVITTEVAKQAKEMLPAFLTKIRPDMKQK